ncbi:MAG TPA: hypothetical protein VEW28_03245 [Candidatus Kapabacteria bacterium]|nr:hypothetical protein [Candidatus Kapabacteria bacterium]
MYIRPKYPVIATLACLFLAACSTLGIDNFFTFNLNKSFSFPVPPQTPVGQLLTSPGIPLSLDSALAANNTALKYLKAVKLTKLAFTSDNAAYPVSSFDTMIISVKTDSLPLLWLGSYSRSVDATVLSNNDFAAYVKSSRDSFIIAFKANKAPATLTNFTANFTLALTANPLP